MKKNKAFLELEGKTLVERSLTVLQAVFKEVIISSNTPELFARYNVPVIQDRVPERGPLEGLFQGLISAAHEWVFFVACDMPFLEEKVIRFLFTLISNYDAVVPRFQSRPHPLHAFYHRRCLEEIKNNLEANRLKIIDFYANCSVRIVDERELQVFSDMSKILCNVNTPDEWLAIIQG